MANDKTGILGEKLGMTQVFDENNRIVPVTVVKAGPCVVTQIRTQEKDGYSAVQLAYGQIDPRKVTKPVADHFKAANETPRRHLVELRTDAFRRALTGVLDKLDKVEGRLAEAERDIDAAHGGDADAAQRARRALLDVDAALTEADLAKKWPELDAAAGEAAINAAAAVSQFGTEAERRLLDEVVTALERARASRDPAELERQLRLVRRLSVAAYQRDPETWEFYLENAASEIAGASDLPRAQRLVAEGKAAAARGDTEELKRIVKQLWSLLPLDAADRRKGFDSGVR